MNDCSSSRSRLLLSIFFSSFFFFLFFSRVDLPGFSTDHGSVVRCAGVEMWGWVIVEWRIGFVEFLLRVMIVVNLLKLTQFIFCNRDHSGNKDFE